jgi:enoyl-CoA hydratase/carnithine racemase
MTAPAICAIFAKRTHGLANHSQQAVWGWRQLPVPVIAAHGVAFGGGFQLAIGADMRFLAPDTRMSIMRSNGALCRTWPARRSCAPGSRRHPARSCFHRPDFSAQEAMSYGLATRICDDPRAAALAAAREIAGKNPDAIRGIKRMLNGLAAILARRCWRNPSSR